MAVSTTDTFSGPYVANGLTVEFPFTFKAFSADEVRVRILNDDGTDSIVSPSAYNVSLGTEGGTAIFLTAPSSGSVYVESDPSFLQDIRFSTSQAYRPETVNEANDRAAVRDLSLKAKLDRAPVIPPWGLQSRSVPVVNEAGDGFDFVDNLSRVPGEAASIIPALDSEGDPSTVQDVLDDKLDIAALLPVAGPWAFTATAGQTVFTASGSSGKPVIFTIWDQPLDEAVHYTRAGDVFTLIIPASEGDEVLISAISALGATTLSLTASSIGNPLGGSLQNFLASRGREIWITDWPYLADPTGTFDAAPAFRAARDYLEGIGGGVIRVPPRSTFKLASTETITVWEIDEQETRQVCLSLPAGVSLIGAGSHTTKFVCTAASANIAIATLDGANQALKGFEIEGNGATISGPSGVFHYSSESYEHVLENVDMFDIYIHDFGSYGLGNNLQCRRVTVDLVWTSRTGADGIDWKQRYPLLTPVQTRPTTMTRIDIDAFGQRAGAGTPSGIGVRGAVHMDGITIRGIPTGMPGVQFVGGLTSDVGDNRLPASMSTITNWYMEGADPKGDAIAISVFACEGVGVGVGTAKYARVEGLARSFTPYGYNDGGLFQGVTVIPAHGRTAFLATAKGTHFRGARIVCDKVYWDAKRRNLTPGQTVLPLPFASTTNNSAARYLVKSTSDGLGPNVILTEGVDYNWTTNSATLAVGSIAGEQYFAVFAPIRGFRIEAYNCSVDGVQDYFVADRFNIETQAYADSGSFDVVWEGHGNLGMLNSNPNVGMMARNPMETDEDFRLSAQGAGSVLLGELANRVGFFGVTGATKRTVTGATADEKIDSLIAALATYGQITDSTT